MGYKSLEACIRDLDKTGQLIRIKEEVDPYLEMSSIQLRAYEKGAPAILFEKIKGCEFRALSNLFGDVNRSKFLFRDTMDMVQRIALLKKDPILALKNPTKYFSTPKHLLNALPRKISKRSAGLVETTIDKLPQITCWKNDGGPYVTLPIVYTEDADQPGWMKSNMGMYRIQLGGNDFIQNEEIGLHYQIHRGIGVHQSKANAKGLPLKVSIFVGGPPSLSFSAVMPLPEGLPEFAFAGMLGGKRMRYFVEDGYTVCADADFVITGEVMPHDVKPEGPFGDHLGYYSLTHDFPLMKVHKVYHKKEAIWPFTVVGRPPQEDTSFGAMIHELAGETVKLELPGVKAVHAVDASGVHPLLFAIGSERYTPYVKHREPAEILTQANHILGFGQMSLAKFLFIAAEEDNKDLNIHEESAFLHHILERVDWERDLHFYTKTSMDTLDYSGEGLNTGSKVVVAAAGDKRRDLLDDFQAKVEFPEGVTKGKLVAPGILALSCSAFESYESAEKEMAKWSIAIKEILGDQMDSLPLLLMCDDADFVSETYSNFLWTTFTRANPSHDIYGIDSYTHKKHWACKGSLMIDTRIKPHHAPPLILDDQVEKRVDEIFKNHPDLAKL
ncbi:MAG: UbiD family decarboxylase [Flavobacteriales bacterium]|nr:UbiD family decarboxylase [Flavobacteriales bacterium]